MREAREWSARELAEACKAAGYGHMTRDVIASIEMGRRIDITVDELAVLTHVLGAADPEASSPTASILLADAGLAAARAGGPRWLAEPDVWLAFAGAEYDRERRLKSLIERFATEAGVILGFDADPEIEGKQILDAIFVKPTEPVHDSEDI